MAFEMIYFISRLAKRMAKLTLASCSPPPTPLAPSTLPEVDNWTPACYSEGSDEGDSDGERAVTSILPVFNSAMDQLCTAIGSPNRVSPLTYQPRTSWEKTTIEEKNICIEKVTEALGVVCNVILKSESIANDLKPLIEAYKNARTKNVKTQILSLCAHRFPIKTLQEIHASYMRISRNGKSSAHKNMPGNVDRALQ
jgi:hypothetical protein